jgi:hypothetical protein
VNDGEGELSFGQVFCKAFIVRVLRQEGQENDRVTDELVRAYLCTLKVHVVVTNLEVHSKEVYQRDIIATGLMVSGIQPK